MNQRVRLPSLCSRLITNLGGTFSLAEPTTILFDMQFQMLLKKKCPMKCVLHSLLIRTLRGDIILCSVSFFVNRARVMRSVLGTRKSACVCCRKALPKQLSSIIPCTSYSVRNWQTLEEQAGIPAGRGYVDQIFTPRQV